jgi:hypothetical protein
MILKFLKLVLNRTDLGQMLDTKKMRLVDTFPMIYHCHFLNLSFEKLRGNPLVSRHSKNRVGQFNIIAREVQAHVTGKFNTLFFAGRKSIVQISSF